MTQQRKDQIRTEAEGDTSDMPPGEPIGIGNGLRKKKSRNYI
jgi:hypothetical protein